MLGKIIGIEGNTVLVKLSVELSTVQNIIGLYVIMKDNDIQIVGEIVEINNEIITINLIGEIINNEFVFGVIRKPAFSSVVSLVKKENVSKIIGINNYQDHEHLYLGKSPVYSDVQIGVNVNNFFSNHFAIFGSTGSGKSCSVARIFQNLFEKKDAIAYRASIFIFDAYGEYHSAFGDLHKKNPNINFKTYTTNLHFSETEVLRIPLWLLDVDDLALLLGADRHSQLPIIEKALKLVTIFGQDEELVLKHKNDIIARALLDILSSGRPPVQIRDQIISILTHYHTRELNLETEIFQPGYTRPLKQLFAIDASGKIREIELITSFIESLLTDDLELKLPDGSFPYNLKDLKDAFDFALISEGVLKSDRIYDDSNVLKIRLNSLINGSYNTYFDYPEYVTRHQYIKQLLTSHDGKKAQIVNFNINYIDDRLAKTITKIYSKLLFNYSKELEKRASLPFHIILEEAHRYVQNDNDVNLLGYNIFERITKEGRKYGVLIGLISQRPSELSETTLSQCGNFLIFKMIHPKDIAYIKEMLPSITNEIIKNLRILQPGVCMAFGLGFKVPSMIKFSMPNPEPESSSADISKTWFVRRKKESIQE
ncbi:MAG: ATP-binding protein [Bacilli bacterium]|nr:ATP-binding protein [Bacilli bacterium]MDD4547727.1 ATP-binding protein [Bacilli bacterium]